MREAYLLHHRDVLLVYHATDFCDGVSVLYLLLIKLFSGFLSQLILFLVLGLLNIVFVKRLEPEARRYRNVKIIIIIILFWMSSCGSRPISQNVSKSGNSYGG